MVIIRNNHVSKGNNARRHEATRIIILPACSTIAVRVIILWPRLRNDLESRNAVYATTYRAPTNFYYIEISNILQDIFISFYTYCIFYTSNQIKWAIMSINLSSNLNKIYFYFNQKYWVKLIDFDRERERERVILY